MAKTPVMPSLEAFIESTTVRLGGKLGINKFGPVLSRDRLVMIDNNLYFWWLVPEGNTDHKLRATLRLMKACSDWAWKHQTDKGASRTGAQRMPAVQNLVTQCKLWLGVLNVRAGKMRSLRGDYRSERGAYKTAKTQGQKINPVGGSFVHELLEKAEFDDALKNGPLGTILAKPMDQMTEQDFQTLASAMLPDGDTAARTVYMDSTQRLEEVLLIRNGVFCDKNGEPLTAAVAYAMDKYGTMHGHDFRDAMFYGDRHGGAGFFNHSSFLAGKDVICAGTIERLTGFDADNAPQFKNWWMITTLSGHYKPTADNLKNCLISLRASGLDLDRIVAHVAFPNKTYELASRFIR